MLHYLRLLRPLNCLITGVAVFIGGLMIASADFSLLAQPNIYMAALAAFLIAGAGNTINDYTDVDVDKINRPDRPIPSGAVGKRPALVFSAVLFLTGIILAGIPPLNFLTFGIATFNSLVLIVYSVYLQDKILLGNLAISYLVGSAFLFGGAALGNIILPVMLMILAFFANLSREIVKDLEDIEGDKKGLFKKLTGKVKESAASVAERFGIKKGKIFLRYRKKTARNSAASSLIATIAFSPIPYFLELLSVYYLLVLVPADVVFGFCAYQIISEKGKYSRISRNIKLGMVLGLAAFAAGILV